MSSEAAEKLRDLLERLLRDDARAWDEVIQTYSGFLLAIARRTIGNYGGAPSEQDAEDAAADVWRNLLEHDRRIVRDCLARGNFLQTLQVLSRNRAVDILRRRHHAATRPLTDEDAATHPAPAPAESPIEPEAISAAMQQLTPRERTLVNLFFLHGKKYSEIAGLTGIPQNSIGPTLARALCRLQASLQAEK